MNEQKGGFRSQRSALENKGKRAGSASEAVEGKGERDQFRDFSGPQEKTGRETTEAEDQEVRDLLGKFAVLNGVRSVLMVAGGVVGLVTALA